MPNPGASQNSSHPSHPSRLYFGDNLDILREHSPRRTMGFFVTLAEPSMTDHAANPMSKESVAFGFYDEPRFGAEYPKLQILTTEGLMAGTERPR